MARKRPIKEITFDKKGMLNFRSLNDAMAYFTIQNAQAPRKLRSRKAVVWLFGETYELKVGRISANMSLYLNDPNKFFLQIDRFFGTQAQKQFLEYKIQEWVLANREDDGAVAFE